MALAATLTLDGEEYNILECEYEFIQPIDSNGKPSGSPRGGLIHFTTILASEHANTVFHEWMLNKSDMKDGEFGFLVTDRTEQWYKRLKFQHAHCIHLYEYFNNQNEIQMYTKITLSAAVIAFGEGGVYTNNEFLAE